MTRTCRARDWGTGDELTAHLLGHLSTLQIHHIFPKSLLYKHGYSRREVNAIANFTFLTQETNLEVSNKDPAVYIPHYEKLNPGVFASHWIPMDPDLRKIKNYPAFLAERRKLLAKAANEFLDKLSAGTVPQPAKEVSIFDRESPVSVGEIADEDEQKLLQGINDWVVKKGLPEGEMGYELLDPADGSVLANLDLAWPNGLQEGLSQPVALLIDESVDVEEAVNQAGYRFFTDKSSFRRYVKKEVLATSDDSASDSNY